MSLINKMLQDLDARGGASGTLQEPAIKAVPTAEREQRRWLLVGGAVLAGVVLALGGGLGWQAWQARVATRAAAALPVARAPAAPVNVAPSVAPAAQGAPAPTDTPAAAVPGPAPVALAAASTAAAAPAVSATPAVSAAPAAAAAPSAAAPSAAAAPAVAHHKPRGAGPRELREARPHPAPRGAPTSAPAAAQAAQTATAGGEVVREQNPLQQSENSYRRALINLQEGRVADALADLQRALDANPRNEAARQTLISLLLESKRTDEAMRELALALRIDPRQPGLAMVLARLQLERNGPALDTLERTLPYAEHSADYQSLLAGVLQRQQRHADAIVHYNAALKLQPQNAVWWMGLGISLQADHHPAEARQAFTRARSLPGLSPELQAFVERQLELLAR